MFKLKSILFIACVQITFSSEKVGVPNGSSVGTYRAGVVEFGVNFVSDVQVLFERNTLRYLDLIQEAASQHVDILVFPESTLNYGFTSDRARVLQHAIYLPDPEELLSPCDLEDSNRILKAISCAARDGHLYIIINVSEKLACDADTKAEMRDPRPCHKDQHYLFNTNLVFDRYGVVVSRYRKTHLFGEIAFNTTARPELKTFMTDFGVEFGHLICFDLQYDTPAQVLLKRGITNFVLPLMWYSELPFLTAVQYEEAWARSSGANLLAAGASSPLSGSGGSGVFAGAAGARAALLSGHTATRLLVADLYKSPDQDPGNGSSSQIISENPRAMNMLRDHLHLYSVRLLQPDILVGGHVEQICYGDFCCSFNISVSLLERPSGPVYDYALVAFRGVRTFSGVASGGVENCGLVACTSFDVKTCGFRFPKTTEYSPYVVFEKIELTGQFTVDNAAQYPTSLTGAMLPLTTEQFSTDDAIIDDKRQITVRLTDRQNDLLTFGVFGRVFSKDCDPVTDIEPEAMFMTVLGISRTARVVDDNHIEYCSNNSEDIFDSFWSKLRVLLFIVVIYVLEIM